MNEAGVARNPKTAGAYEIPMRGVDARHRIPMRLCSNLAAFRLGELHMLDFGFALLGAGLITVCVGYIAACERL